MLARMGTVSVAELAAVLGRPADGLYYHLRVLQRAGLVEAAGSRGRGGRNEALVRAAAAQFAIRYPAAPGRRGAVTSIVRAMLRIGARDFARAIVRPDVRVDGPARELWALRTTAWLSPAQVRQVNRLMLELSRSGTRTAPRGRLYAVTVLLAPLTHRDPRTGRRPRRRESR